MYKFLAVLLLIAVYGVTLWAYGTARFDAGYQSATDAQRAAADKVKKQAEDAKAASQKRIDTLGHMLADTSAELEKVKAHALKTDPTYEAWRAGRVHPVALGRIWGVRDPPAGGGRVRTPGPGAAGQP